jgi:(1->4)-alpha-D-glucan 1-alpha-D-glucosylmutase
VKPLSTYRLQLHAGFTFDDARFVADYIKELGVTHVYSSPYLQAAPGSPHGYDVVDHRAINEELGGVPAHDRFSKRLKKLGLGQILDIVPNHMSLAQNNRYWADVLENGPHSHFAQYFDIDWESSDARFRNKVLLPILEDQYGQALSKGSVKLVRYGTRFGIECCGNRLPIAPHSLSLILSPAAETCASDSLAFFADSFACVARHEDNEAATILRHERDRKVLFSLLDRFCTEEPQALACIDRAIDTINADMDALDTLLQQQNYRIAHWRTADEDLVYRRFFDVNSLIGLRMEREQVFTETHELIVRWLRLGVLDGIRIDHPDGLRVPQEYFERLRDAAPKSWIVIEKILARKEPLRETWPIDGTTGYEFLNMVNGLFVSPEGLIKLDEVYRNFLPEPFDYTTLVHDKKIAVMQEALGSDVNRLTTIFQHICEKDRDHRDYSRAELRRAIREVAANFPLYRTYVNPESNEVEQVDASVIQSAIDGAIRNRPDIARDLFDFIADVLLLRSRGELESDFLLRFQQFTSPVMAKGFEDTVLYCYNRLTGMNEVGSDPSNPAVSIDDFHWFNQQAQLLHPGRMVTLTTHDTKRAEDVRARLAVLSELSREFESALIRWSEMNEVYRNEGFPDRNTEYLYYQTLIGAWPLSPERAIAYMEKATREAKQQTSWTHPIEKFEQALRGFIDQTLASVAFVAEMEAMVKKIQTAGRTNSLAQTLLKYTVPGVPDLYQGSELWDHRLVDPDNRTPVDFNQRRELLAAMKAMSVDKVLEHMEEGAPKLWVIHHALQMRNQHPECFGDAGDYEPLMARGDMRDHVVAFLRGGRIVTVVPRLTVGVESGWQRAEIVVPPGKWRNLLAGCSVGEGQCRMADLFSLFPVALLVREG